ncbi:MAG: Glutamine--fructose-6-phosphate aminotransferase [isomerizing] [Elusimicrobia bacterium]|nr:Glutamine--fructose-6-phosphate aminotransferase [isomerizing] [Elusimicrobiota bacterium]
MCGILGYVGHLNATQVLIDGLKKLEYRGYDSAGVAVLTPSGFEVRRSVGKLAELENLLHKQPVNGHLGLGHTRWATHGAPSEVNAHPHTDHTGKIIVVHNGIIENYISLKEKLAAEGCHFKSETDTEVVGHLISHHRQKLTKRNSDEKEIFVQAVLAALKEIKGTFALGIVCSDIPDVVLGARRDCPLIVGMGDGQNFLASDVPAILSYTREVVFLEDGDLAVLSQNGVEFLNVSGKVVQRKVHKISWDPVQAEKAGYKHFMIKEIHEQPRIVENTLLGRLDTRTFHAVLHELDFLKKEADSLSRVRFIACGTSWHASLVGSYLIEKYSGIPCQVDIASEFRYRDPIIDPGTLVIAVSQSGETADTLAALRLAKKKGARVLGIANVVGSSITRDANGFFLTHCGPEIGVASTKAFMGQLVAMHLLALHLARFRKFVSNTHLVSMGKHMTHLSQWMTETLECEEKVMQVAKKYFRRKNFLYLGRNVNYPVALEGALKLKEISYIHAEGYPAGEMKHGPIALIDENMPIVALVTKSSVYDKMVSNVEEARSRGADVIAIATKGDPLVSQKAADVIFVPEVPEDLSPLINVIPLQLLAYHIAVFLGCDVDQPRNLAKSVTVE